MTSKNAINQNVINKWNKWHVVSADIVVPLLAAAIGAAVILQQNNILDGQNSILDGQSGMLEQQNDLQLDHNRQEQLINYINEVSNLIKERSKYPEKIFSELVTGRTKSVLRYLDGERKGQAIEFLASTGLLIPENKERDPIVDLSSADLREADLSRIDLRNAIIRFANLEGANLQVADLRMVDFGYSNLINASIEGANLLGANLTQTKLDNANASKTTKFPSNFSIEMSGVILEQNIQ